MNAASSHPADQILMYLRCPTCQQPLDIRERTLRCPNGHCFDLARQGSVDLSGGRLTHSGDTSDMVEARVRLASTGLLSTITEAVVCAVTDLLPGDTSGMILDVGTGTGHHLAAVLDAREGLVGVALDISKAALRRAARAHPRAMAVRADIWRGIPVADGAASVVLDVFAPRSADEFHRVLREDGHLVVVTPTPGHLAELVAPLGLLAVDPRKDQRLAETLATRFEPGAVRVHESTVPLTPGDVAAFVGMGPSSWHLAPEDLAHRLRRLPQPLRATVSVQVSLWRPR